MHGDTNKNLGLFLRRSDDPVSLLCQPAVEFVGRMDTVGRTDRPDLFVSGGLLDFPIQQQLNRTPDIVAVFPAPVLGIPLYRPHDRYSALR